MDSVQEFSVRAVQIARRILLRQFPADSALARNPIIFQQGDGLVALFRYGVAVFFNLSPLEQQHLIDQTLSGFLQDPISGGEEEQAELLIRSGQEERVVGGKIALSDDSMPRLQILAEVIARSVLLASYESRIRRNFDQVEPLAEKLATNRSPRTNGKILQTIGNALVTEHDMVGRAAVTEKPDLLWDHGELEGLYRILEDEFELQERDSALARKLDLISRTAQTSLELLHAKRSLRVEWYIVLLIVVEIGLTLFELFIKD
ncbi:RMD1 family protein [Desulfogranum japonicum]|uniref:RMD1 family protein n=1 Tax=Desulfogranum japonicum TaxID=231447 RepID=UPI000413948C|nr:RMD1 family protein [Desulfogranum japonicum]